jgi:Xaa-Pro aminopeptidase
MVIDELAAGYRGYTAQIGLPIFVGEPEKSVRQFFEEITLPGFRLIAELIRPGTTMDEIRKAGGFFRDRGHQSRPILLHGMDLVTGPPHVFVEETEEGVLEPGQVVMLEPNPIDRDGNLGMFYGHTFILTDSGSEMITERPMEIVITR